MSKWLIKYRRDGERTKELVYNTEKGMLRKYDELNDDPSMVDIRIFKEVTYGDQMDLFDAKHSPF